MDKVRVAVVGVGYLGRYHAEKYLKIPEAHLVGVVDIDRDRAETTALRVGTQPFGNHREILGQVDAVSIAVPTPQHFHIAMDFLQEGVDVLIEKPITSTLEEADTLIEAARAQDRFIQVGHLERFNPAVRTLDGVVRNPLFIESHRLSRYKPRGTDVSVVLDLMIHDIDIILNFVKNKVKEIRAAGMSVVTPHVDIANARLEFENGCVANVTASRISLKDERKLRLFQRDKYISIDFANQEITVIDRSEEEKAGLIPGMRVQQLDFPREDALEAELKAFIASVLQRTPPRVNGETGREALEIALQVVDQIHATSDPLLEQ
ncbi:MAG: Gfo/Idh/MocA family oxidoreductase [Deltaproteobacteria bacterium]|nr:Gfo/Idh/MocA family oxidoreductase [Deltaproteobacteria bacterium]MBW2042388.1 Gfo/Idh/MocA family oxidoreductase [Deltaproteobacteria bacterium]MBW2133286.1 Gfo/Idh/MocA family oxidoreductase [Deltaproteobacteria bacterium]